MSFNMELSGNKVNLMRALTLIAACWGMRVLWDLRTEARVRQLTRSDEVLTSSDIVSSIGLCGAMLVAQLLWRPLFAVVARAMIPKKARWSPAVWGAKVNNCCDSVFKCSYFAAMTIWGWSLLRDEGFMPWVLGGTGDTRNCWTDDPTKPELRQFYLTAFGFHLSEVAMLAIDARHPDFWEMLLHHIVSCALIFFSFVLNYTRIGSLVLLLHGATDIFIYASKVVVDTPYIRLAILSYFALVIAYAWFRIFVFPVYIMRSAWLESIAALPSNLRHVPAALEDHLQRTSTKGFRNRYGHC